MSGRDGGRPSQNGLNFTKPKRKKRYWILGLIAFGVSADLFLFSLFFSEKDELIRREISFAQGENTLEGVLITSENMDESPPCIVFVHGSGDTPRDNFGYYETYWKKFAQQGWCSLSWDKPGVGGSSGDWMKQTMQERAAEVSAAVDYLRSFPGLRETPIGLIGFSQAGWVMPKTAKMRDDLAFIISVSGAGNWMEQSRYSGSIRLQSEGYSDAEIATVTEFSARIDEAIMSGVSYQRYTQLMTDAPEGEEAPMSQAYWGFVQRNWQSDVRKDLRDITIPFLGIFGGHDAYVDPVNTAKTYIEELAKSTSEPFEIVTFQKADHGLMLSVKVQPNHQGFGAWGLLFKIWFYGERMFPDDYFPTLQNWLNRYTNERSLDG